MIESVNIIRSLGLSPIFEDLYVGRADLAVLLYSIKYPRQFHGLKLEDCEPLTAGGLVPLFSDSDFYDIYLYDPVRNKFIVKFLEEPDKIKQEFDDWQQLLAYILLEIAGSGPSDEKLSGAAEAMGFKHTAELFSLFSRMEKVTDSEIEPLEEQFIRGCAT